MSQDETVAIEVEIPHFGIMVQSDEGGEPYLGLQVTTSGTLHQFYLCSATESDATARVFSREIMRAGREARARSGRTNLIIPEGVTTNGLRSPQGG